jgi:CubicO group peptidase (beta-lactamase class C family)
MIPLRLTVAVALLALLSPAAHADLPAMHRYIDAGLVPGTVTEIMRRGKLVHFSVQRDMDVAGGVPMREDTIDLDRPIEIRDIHHTGELPLWLPGPGMSFGLGYGVVTDRGAAATPLSEGAAYWGGAYCTLSWFDPEQEVVE